MNRNKLKFLIFVVVIILNLSFFMVSHFLQAAWQAPTGQPYTGNNTYPFIFNAYTLDDSVYIIDKSFGMDDKFIVDTNVLYVDETVNRVGILNTAPQSTLDVNGVVRIAKYNSANLPVCNNDMLGSMVFNLDQDRLNVCVNNAWRIVGYDGDGDHWLDFADCDDTDPSINQTAVEVCGNTIDENCNGSFVDGCLTCYRDADADNYGKLNDTKEFQGACPGIGNYVSNSLDCNDANSALNVEHCGDTVTNDCDSQINENCTCTINDWIAPVCPDMSSCLTAVNILGTKFTDCVGSTNQPNTNCLCTCRYSTDHFVSLTPPTCLSCIANTITLYTSKQSEVDCTDTNSIQPKTTCIDNCNSYCSGTTCCNYTVYYSCSGSYRVYHDACGGTSQQYCPYGCDTATKTCKEDPCVYPTTEAACLACGGSWSSYGGGGSCTQVH